MVKIVSNVLPKALTITLVAMVLGSNAMAAEHLRVPRDLGGIAQDLANKLSNFHNEWADTDTVRCEECVSIKGLPGCVKSSILDASKPMSNPDMCLTVKGSYSLTRNMPEFLAIPVEIRMGIRVPKLNPLRLFRPSLLDQCQSIPAVLQFLSETFASPNLVINEVCGCARDMCNIYGTPLLGLHAVI